MARRCVNEYAASKVEDVAASSDSYTGSICDRTTFEWSMPAYNPAVGMERTFSARTTFDLCFAHPDFHDRRSSGLTGYRRAVNSGYCAPGRHLKYDPWRCGYRDPLTRECYSPVIPGPQCYLRTFSSRYFGDRFPSSRCHYVRARSGWIQARSTGRYLEPSIDPYSGPSTERFSPLAWFSVRVRSSAASYQNSFFHAGPKQLLARWQRKRTAPGPGRWVHCLVVKSLS